MTYEIHKSKCLNIRMTTVTHLTMDCKNKCHSLSRRCQLLTCFTVSFSSLIYKAKHIWCLTLPSPLKSLLLLHTKSLQRRLSPKQGPMPFMRPKAVPDVMLKVPLKWEAAKLLLRLPWGILTLSSSRGKCNFSASALQSIRFPSPWFAQPGHSFPCIDMIAET